MKTLMILCLCAASSCAADFNFQEIGSLYEKGTMPSMSDFSKTLYGQLAYPKNVIVGNLYVEKVGKATYLVPATPAPAPDTIIAMPGAATPPQVDRFPVRQNEALNAATFYSPPLGKYVGTWHYFRVIKINDNRYLLMRKITTNNHEFERGCWKIKD